MDASSIGSHEIFSDVKNSYDPGTASSHQDAINQLNSKLSGDADYILNTSNGSTNVNMNGGESAKDVARAFNLVTGETGVTATAVTKVRISSIDLILQEQM